MPKKFLTPINVVNLSSDPASGTEGDVYYNTVSDKLKIYSNSVWSEIGQGSTVYYQTTAPSSPNVGDVWVDSDEVYTTINPNDYMPKSGGTFTGTVNLSTTNISGITTVSNYINRITTNGNSSWLQQDGTGRVHWYWNTLGGTSPTFTNAAEDASALTLHVNNNGNGGSFFHRSANGVSASAGGPITWTNTLYVDLNNITYKGNRIPTVIDKLNVFATTTSAELAGVISDETGTGSLVFATSPTFAGTIGIPGTGTNQIKAGTGDGASFTTYNMRIRSWWGIGFTDYQDLNTATVYIDTRSGLVGASGTPTLSEHLTTKSYVDSVSGGLNSFFLSGM